MGKIEQVKNHCIMLLISQPVVFTAPKKTRGRPKKSPEKIAAEKLGRKIRQKRRAKKLSQSALAQLVGYGLYRQSISDIERGRLVPTIFQFVALAENLNADLQQWVNYLH